MPVNSRVWPELVNWSCDTWSRRSRGTPSNAIPRFNDPIPWLGDHSVSLAPVPFRYRAEFIKNALVIAGLGGMEAWLIKY